MDRNEFVSTLRAALTGVVPPSVVEENVRYYDAYISQEIAGGKGEQEVLEMLGDPRLIARTIIDTQGQGSYQEEYVERDFRRETENENASNIRYRSLNLNTWYAKLLLIVLLALVLILIFVIVGGILSWVLPVLLPVLVIIWIVRILSGGRR